jgi:hypothetical protein
MKHNKNKRKNPSDICKQIIEQLRKESDPMAQEMLRQRLHHFNTLLRNKSINTYITKEGYEITQIFRST